MLFAIAAATAGAPAHAEQPATDTTAPFSVNARLNFSMVYPRFLRFRVGTAGATVNLMTFTVAAASVGAATPVAATGGDAGGSAVNVEVVGNNGQVTITPTNSSTNLGIGTGTASDGRINYNQIATTTSLAQLPAPVLSNTGGAPVLPTLNTALVTNRTAVWTYSYLNQTIPSAGTYGGTVVARGGRVTYTATMP
ncbi:hypothetical protein DSM104440_00673 [Usitatibacter palustris]|uniref:Uncharacterized protein n=1 Tax=Usitatibacter palustris TaxID=2732487 RepID=A0A6M4H5F1_9PROT|nr:hypothetical protein DSM104440_00673 [Usitatibacter palustris]